MARGRGDPERIYQEQRAGVFRRLVDEQRLEELDAEHWIASWERTADELGHPRRSAGYWDEAWRWIAGERALRMRPSA